MSPVACLAPEYFPTLTQKMARYKRKVIENKMCVFSTKFV
jgi:hypothetical protein